MNELKEKLVQIFQDAIDIIENSGENDLLEQIRVRYLGKKGNLTEILKKLGTLSAEERPVVGEYANEIRQKIEQRIAEKKMLLQKLAMSERLKNEKIDITLPSKKTPVGSRHPIAKVLTELEDIFTGMGFTIESGPDIEYTYYNFDALNTPADHPARDMKDTFYITPEGDNKVILRTQTSNVQIRVMEKGVLPIRMICPGRVYRPDTIDATHLPMFTQLEGLVVDKGVTMRDLRDTLQAFISNLYGESTKIRFRPHHFPFTEPSAEVDMSCFICGGKGCSLCKGEGWIEILGCGMVHPNVLKNCGIDPDIYTGFAFGFGIERIVMFKYGIEDLRYLYDNIM